MRTVLVCGGRGWRDEMVVWVELCRLRREGFTNVIHGGARGADSLADHAARRLGCFGVKEFPARWEVYGRAAGMIRNEQMLDQEPDLVVAFHEDLRRSRGTAHTVREARRRGIPVRVITRASNATFFEKKVDKETLSKEVEA